MKQKLINEIIRLLRQQIAILMTKIRNRTIYESAVAHLGIDASPNDLAPDELGCAESVTEILSKHTMMPVITGTYTLYERLEHSPEFKRVTIPMPGNVILSPTGTSRLGRNAPFVGHTGIIGERGMIMSNDSFTGKWSANYTLARWMERWKVKGEYPVYFYALV